MCVSLLCLSLFMTFTSLSLSDCCFSRDGLAGTVCYVLCVKAKGSDDNEAGSMVLRVEAEREDQRERESAERERLACAEAEAEERREATWKKRGDKKREKWKRRGEI